MNAALVRAGVTAFWLAIPLSSAFALDPICVTSQNTAWALAPNNGGPCGSTGVIADPLVPATFSLAEPATETALKPIGDFTFDVPFTTPKGYYTIRDEDSVSDYIVFGNT